MSDKKAVDNLPFQTTVGALKLELKRLLSVFKRSKSSNKLNALEKLLENEDDRWQWYSDYIHAITIQIQAANLHEKNHFEQQLITIDKSLDAITIPATAAIAHNLRQQIQQQQFICFNAAITHDLTNYRNHRNDSIKYLAMDKIKYRGKTNQEFTKYQRIKNTDDLLVKLGQCDTHEKYYNFLIKIAGVIDNTKDHHSALKGLLLVIQERVLQHLQQTHCDPALLNNAHKIANHSFRHNLANNLEDYKAARQSFFSGRKNYIKDQFDVRSRNELFGYIDWLNSILAQIDAETENADTAKIYVQYVEACTVALAKINDPKHALHKLIATNQQAVASRFLDHYPPFQGDQLARVNAAQQLAMVKTHQDDVEQSLTQYQNKRNELNDTKKITEYEKFLADAIINQILASKVIKSGNVQIKSDGLGTAFNLLGVMSASMGRNPDLAIKVSGKAFTALAVAGQISNEQMQRDRHASVSQNVDYDQIAPFARAVAREMTKQYREGITASYRGFGDNTIIQEIAQAGAERVTSYLEDGAHAKPNTFEELVEAATHSVSNRYTHSRLALKETPTQRQQDARRPLLQGDTLEDLYERGTPVYPGMLAQDGRWVNKKGTEKKPGPFGFRWFKDKAEYDRFIGRSIFHNPRLPFDPEQADLQEFFYPAPVKANDVQKIKAYQSEIDKFLTTYSENRAKTFSKNIVTDVKHRGKSYEKFSKFQQINSAKELISKLYKRQSHQDDYSFLVKVSGVFENTKTLDDPYRTLLLDIQKRTVQLMVDTGCNKTVVEQAENC